MPKLPLPVTINTTPAILALSDAIGGTYAARSRMMGCSVGNLWKLTSEGELSRVYSVESLAYYAQKCAMQGGPAMAFTVTPNGDLFWEIRNNGISKTGYAKGIKNETFNYEDHSNEYDDDHDDGGGDGGGAPGSGVVALHERARASGWSGAEDLDGNPFGG